MNDILKILFERYLGMVQSSPDFGKADHSRDYIEKFIIHALTEINTLPEDKLNRWLGYVQGVLISYDVTDSLTEREFSRPLFHKVYRKRGFEIPKTTNI